MPRIEKCMYVCHLIYEYTYLSPITYLENTRSDEKAESNRYIDHSEDIPANNLI